VFYRASALEKGNTLELVGWVMNMKNGNVKAHVQGATEAVQKFITWCHDGPMMASVQKVHIESSELETGLMTFEIRYL
jgi:acylphosphatase